MIDRFAKLGTALVSDVLDEAGFHSQTLDPSLGFIGAAKAICGPAICVQGGAVWSPARMEALSVCSSTACQFWHSRDPSWSLQPGGSAEEA
ncbi:hypothetical protein [Thioclava sp. F36-7]|uniref:hypothetical protein n=1 Tax=Thioclava sp. F36-7 TaxID=1915317 RepID=UPI00099796FF|nr:hypothetical protein [Thioclava sp. F36-7]